MDAATMFQSASVSLKFSDFRSGSPVSISVNSFLKNRDRCAFSQSNRRQRCLSLSTPKRFFSIRASTSPSDSSDTSDTSSPIAPLQLESPIGQFLSQMLNSHPHLIPAAVDQQLEQLQIDRETEKSKEDPAAAGTDLVLYKRIAEVKASDRKRALEEILYTLVVQKFVEADVSLVPSISASSNTLLTHFEPNEEKLARLHSSVAYEMLKNHLSLILGKNLDDNKSIIAPISKLRVGQVYAASIMYGYFLKRVDQRFRLEKSMKTLPWGESEGQEDTTTSVKQSMPDESRPFVGMMHPEVSEAEAAASSSFSSSSFGADGFGDRVKPCKLRTYVMSFDTETLQSYATIRSREAFSIIEKHTEALFGRPEIVITPEGSIDTSKDEVIKISFGGLKRLILEAATFGSFLWDVESYVDTRYHFVAN